MTNFIHIPVNAREFGRWCGLRGLNDQDSALHALVTGLFGRQALQPFRFYESQDAASIYGYSASGAEELTAISTMTATPDVERIISGPFSSKPLPALPAATRIGFEVRVSPVRRVGNQERDAFAADLALGYETTREESYLRWFARRLGGAAEIEEFRISKMRRLRTLRKDRRVELPEAVFQGTLTVSDQDRFAELLSGGIGRQKAYGYGMLLLRPADPVRF